MYMHVINDFGTLLPEQLKNDAIKITSNFIIQISTFKY